MNGAAALLHLLVFLCGLGIILATWRSIIVTIILPRMARSRAVKVMWMPTYRLMHAIAGRIDDAARRDEVLALLGPLNLVGLLFAWMGAFVVGFALMFWGLGQMSVGEAFDLAGSSVFTLGFATGPTHFAHALMFVAAASGMIVIGLQIGYLPTLYAAYGAREVLVTLLNMRCAERGVLTGAMVLRYHPLPASRAMLAQLFAAWEASAARIIESHTNYPWLIVFRSPRATESWITAMLAVLDAIELLEVISPDDVPVEAGHCRYACRAVMRVLSDFCTPTPKLNRERAPLTRDAFVRDLAACGFCLPGDTDRAWAAFQTARMHYEAYALRLACFVDLPDTGWLRPFAE